MSVDVLLTGFEPFGGDGRNPSWDAAQGAAARLREGGCSVVTRELPVEFGRGGEELCTAVRTLRPQLVIATGLAAGRTAITPERVAINVRDARIPDNAGAQPIDEPIIDDGPAAYFSTLPIKAMVVAAVTGSGQVDPVPAAVSQTAGTYVCNDAFYLLQHLLATTPELEGIRGGFIHIPTTDAVSTTAAAAALARMATTALHVRDDVHIGGGAEH